MAKEYGLVLAGGGGKGAYQIGVWKALKQCGWIERIGAVSGASIGAWNAALFASVDWEQAEYGWGHLPSLKQTGDPKQAVSMEGLETLITAMARILNSQEPSGWPMDVYANACPAGTKECRYFRLNERDQADCQAILLASSAFPGVCPPVEIEGAQYIDGGVVDNLPIFPLYHRGFRKFIAVLLSDHGEVPEMEYPDAEFLVVRPSETIGDFFDGTLDFSPEGARRRMELGFRDALRVLEAKK
ncbi:patatin-like phospholipase family protein [Hominifimenecus sp. rT4P-3]|uniref:patatin-like phospholipase family protein n=1 Tax=Hominifimenecus sp. rT4P-3 TaxID=3242979 RepID=UPI003DA6991A